MLCSITDKYEVRKNTCVVNIAVFVNAGIGETLAYFIPHRLGSEVSVLL